MTPQIVTKLKKEIDAGLNTEAQAVYILAGIRKIIEQKRLASQYDYLKFHCDWALHTELKGPFAQRVLGYFESAHLDLLKGGTLKSNGEADTISRMNQFQGQISDFLRRYSLPDFSREPDQWPRFLYLYANVIEDCPLTLRSNNTANNIQEVVVSVEITDKIKGHKLFRVSWHIEDTSGKTGTIFVINSFTA